MEEPPPPHCPGRRLTAGERARTPAPCVARARAPHPAPAPLPSLPRPPSHRPSILTLPLATSYRSVAQWRTRYSSPSTSGQATRSRSCQCAMEEGRASVRSWATKAGGGAPPARAAQRGGAGGGRRAPGGAMNDVSGVGGWVCRGRWCLQRRKGRALGENKEMRGRGRGREVEQRQRKQKKKKKLFASLPRAPVNAARHCRASHPFRPARRRAPGPAIAPPPPGPGRHPDRTTHGGCP